mmetsp:Transcript_55751/g.125734  ORF Transcript_55751/g.125734 Transcript_55751/m.125734 type:complete len:115 (+) Transcript_55751:3-347(+)
MVSQPASVGARRRQTHGQGVFAEVFTCLPPTCNLLKTPAHGTSGRSWLAPRRVLQGLVLDLARGAASRQRVEGKPAQGPALLTQAEPICHLVGKEGRLRKELLRLHLVLHRQLF